MINRLKCVHPEKRKLPGAFDEIVESKEMLLQMQKECYNSAQEFTLKRI